MQALAKAVFSAGILSHHDGNFAEVDRLASELIELSTRYNFVTWLPLGAIHRGWARAISGDAVKGLAWIEDGIRDYRKRGSSLGLSYFLALKAEALHLADRTPEALKIITDAKALAHNLMSAGRMPNCSGSRHCCLRLLVTTRLRSRLPSAQPSESRRSRSRLRWRNVPKQVTRSTAAEQVSVSKLSGHSAVQSFLNGSFGLNLVMDWDTVLADH
jgi:hypothetical protein